MSISRRSFIEQSLAAAAAAAVPSVATAASRRPASPNEDIRVGV
jgi:hypothetical protein